MGAKSRKPLDLSLSPEMIDAAMAAGAQQGERPYGNAAAADELQGSSGLRTFELPDGETCVGMDVGDSTSLGVCGGLDPDIDPRRHNDPNQEKGARASLGLNFRF